MTTTSDKLLLGTAIVFNECAKPFRPLVNATKSLFSSSPWTTCAIGMGSLMMGFNLGANICAGLPLMADMGTVATIAGIMLATCFIAETTPKVVKRANALYQQHKAGN